MTSYRNNIRVVATLKLRKQHKLGIYSKPANLEIKLTIKYKIPLKRSFKVPRSIPAEFRIIST